MKKEIKQEIETMNENEKPKMYTDWVDALNDVKFDMPRIDDEVAAEPILDALYATGNFTTDECDTLVEGILKCIKEAEIMMVVK